MTIPAPLTIDKTTGKLHSPDHAINIVYSNPFPIPFSRKGVTGTMRGAVEHTTACTWQVAVNTFQSPTAKGSAHFLVGSSPEHDGDLMQFVPLGQGYITYHAFAANLDRYGLEHEDGGHPHTPISDKGLWTSALVMEFLSRYAGFPLQLLLRENGQGFGYHRQFADWNLSGHTCPGATMTDNVRRDQRDNILNRAKQIRAAAVVKPRTPGHVAYAAHGDALSWADPVTGLDIPFWTSARRAEQLAWEAAAKAVQP